MSLATRTKLLNLRSKALSLIILLCAGAVHAQRTVADFVNAMPPTAGIYMPQPQMKLLTEGIQATNIFGNVVVPISISDRLLQLRSGDSNEMGLDICLVTAGRDSVLVTIETLDSPQPDSRVLLYGTDWQPYVKQPELASTLDDWLTKEGRKHRSDIERAMPFMMATATYNPVTQALTFKHSMDRYVGRDAKALLDYLKPTLTFKFKGGKFKQ